jgi:hypothetical protein
MKNPSKSNKPAKGIARKQAGSRPQPKMSKALGASHSFRIKQVPNGPFGAAALLDEIRAGKS